MKLKYIFMTSWINKTKKKVSTWCAYRIRCDFMHKIIKHSYQTRNIENEIEDSEEVEIKQELLNEIMKIKYNLSNEY